MRAFIGILAPEHVKEVAVKIQGELKNAGVVGKYVERDNLHINLSFLDEISDGESLEIAAKMDMLAKGYRKFAASICGLKPIPNKNFVRVVAFDVIQDEKLLPTLSSDIQKSIGGDVKPPHMTLCRVKGLKDKKKFSELVDAYATVNLGPFEIESIELIKSELGAEGPKYSVIHESKF